MISICAEEPGDVAAVRQVNELAFGRSVEADVVDRLRQTCTGDDWVSLVAADDGTVVGHILFTPATIQSEQDRVQGMGLAPLAVLPNHQRQGVGSALMEQGLDLLRQRRCPFVIVVGHPSYYPRFGFVPGSAYGLTCQWAQVPDEAFMAIVLDPEKMAGVHGMTRFRDEWDAAVQDTSPAH